MNAVIIFDVSDNGALPEIRQLMRTRGYFLNWNSNNIIYTLPNNIVWRPNTELQQAMNDLNATITQLNTTRGTGALGVIGGVLGTNPVRLLRCVVLNSTPWLAITGE